MENIYSVSQLNAAARLLLEDNFPLIWVSGEISNLSCPHSGHIYFSLKDEHAQIRCAMFKMRNYYLDFKPEDGMQVLVQAGLSIYEQRGDYQLIIQKMEPAGDGQLRRKFEQLKNKLNSEGLFAAEHKKPLPPFPQTIGIITSATGAALQDILTILKRRLAAIKIIVYPAQVQGNAAAKQLVNAMTKANQENRCDLLILARGGGSLEDLWPFNEEIVARAIFASEIPLVTGIGHETDFTIADFTADQRAATPSAAAELVSPDNNELLKHLHNIKIKLSQQIKTILQQKQLTLHNLSTRLEHPERRLQNYAQQLDGIEKRLTLAINNLLKHKQILVTNLGRTLESISPLKTLERGFAIITDSKEGHIIRSVNDVAIDDTINVKLKDGQLSCLVQSH